MKAVTQMRNDVIDPIVREIIEEMGYTYEPSPQQVMYEDSQILSTSDIIKGLKAGSVPGTAVVRWDDKNGMLEANVIDFLLEEEIDSIDVETGEHLKVKSTDVPDGVWHLYS